MNISLLKHKNHKNASRPHEGFVDRLSADPYLDWAIIFAATALVGLVGIMIGVLVYIQSAKHLSDDTTGTSGISQIFDLSKLSTALDYLDIRQSEYDLITNKDVPISADPSL